MVPHRAVGQRRLEDSPVGVGADTLERALDLEVAPAEGNRDLEVALAEGSQDLEEGSRDPEEGRLAEGGNPDLEVDKDSQPSRVSVCSKLVRVAARESLLILDTDKLGEHWGERKRQG